MATKSVSSTQAQNNFGRLLDDVTINHSRYIILRRGDPQAVLLSFKDFARILEDEGERRQIGVVLREMRPKYQIGSVVSAEPTSP